jgi:hypothetical protein
VVGDPLPCAPDEPRQDAEEAGIVCAVDVVDIPQAGFRDLDVVREVSEPAGAGLVESARTAGQQRDAIAF